MGKVKSVPPAIPKQDISTAGTKVKITKASLVHDQHTQLGDMKLGLGLEVKVGKETYSHLFGLDDEVIAGSVGRLLVAIGIDDTTDKELEKKIQALVGTEPTIKNRAGNLYWTP